MASRPPSGSRLEFEIQVEDGSGLLLLRPRTLFGWLAVERLELQIPNVTFPLDITGGMAQFRAQKCRVQACTLRLDGAALTRLSEARAAPLAAAGFTELRARPQAGSIELGAQAKVGGEPAEIVIRVMPQFSGRAVELLVSEVHLLGLSRRPGWLLAHDLLSVLLGAGSSDGDEDTAPLIVGLGRVRLQPLDLFLARALPAAGWKVPTADTMQLQEATLSAEGVRLAWTREGGVAASSESAAPDAGDAALLRNDLSGAATEYRKKSDAAAVERLLSVLLARESTLRAAGELARESLQRWPEFVPAHLALASIDARGAPQAAAEAYAAALDVVASGELSLRLARAAARLFALSLPERAAQFHERVLAEDPTDGETRAALLLHYQNRGDWPHLSTLYQRAIDAAGDSAEKARLLVALGQIQSERLQDPSAARVSLERAVALDSAQVTAWAELGRVCVAQRDFPAAIHAFEQLVLVQSGSPGEARTHAHLAALREQIGELDRAQESWSRALTLSPDDSELWARAAALAERRGDSDRARAAWAKLVTLTPPADQRRLAEEALLRLAVARADLAEARRWRDGAQHPPAPDLLLELAVLEEEAGDRDGALRTLGATLERLPTDEAARIELWRARLSAQLGRDADRRAALLAAWRRAPSSLHGQEALRALAEDAGATGDQAAEARWLDELLKTRPDADWLFRRAELHAAADEWERARARLEETARVTPPSRRLYAEVLGRLGDQRARADVLSELAAGDPSLWIAVAEARLAVKDLDGAATALSAATAHAPDDPAVKAAQGELAWERRAWDEVATLYPPLLEGSSGRVRARNLTRLARALERLGSSEEARARYREATALAEAQGEDLAAAWRRLAELDERAGSYEAAARTWAEAARDARTGDDGEGRAEKHRRAAELLYRRLGRGAESIAELEAALSADGAHLPSLDLLESIQTELGNDEALAATLRKRLLVLAGDPRRRELVRRLAELDSRRGDRDGALHAWQWVLEQDPSDPEAMRQLAQAALESRDTGAAARLAGVVPSSGLSGDERRTLLLALADLLLEGARFEEGERALAAAQALESGDRLALVERRVRVLLDRMIDPVAALAVARTAWDAEPEEPRLLTLVAETALAADDAALRAEALLRLMPITSSPTEWTELVLEAAELFATRLNDPARAQALYEKVLHADPSRLPAKALELAAKKARNRSDEPGLLQALRSTGQAGVDELVRLAQLLSGVGDMAAAAEVLADAIDRHVRDLSDAGQPLDERGRTLMADLSAAAAVSSAHAAAARGLARAAEVEGDPGAAASALGEAALLYRTQLGDPSAAADLLERALARRPDSALLLADFEAVMRPLDDPERLRRAYEMHLQTLSGPGRAPILSRLAQLADTLDDYEARARFQDELRRWEPPRSPAPSTPTPPDPGRGRALFFAVSESHAAQPGLSGPELLQAIADLKRQIDLLPALEVEQSRSLRQRLAWMYRRAGDVHAAHGEFERLVEEEPKNRPFLAALIETCMVEERWRDAAGALDRLQKLTEDNTERAALLYRLGALYQDQLDEEERAVEEYLRAVDLDPTAPRPLWRLVDYYWKRSDDANLIDIARLLHDTNQVASPNADRISQARAWVALALDAFDSRRENLTPPTELEMELTEALGELAERPQPPNGLASAARRLALASAVLPK